MKKVKIMLTAITVMAIVGGSLAFKAKKDLGARCIYTSAASSNACPFALLTSFDGYTAGSIYATTLDPTFTTTQIGGDPTNTCLAGQTGQPALPACNTQQTYVTE